MILLDYGSITVYQIEMERNLEKYPQSKPNQIKNIYDHFIRLYYVL